MQRAFTLFCLDIDECAIKTDNCSLHAICNNTQGSFNCSCKDGFIIDGINSTGNYRLRSHTILSVCSLLNDDEIDDDNEVYCGGVLDKSHSDRVFLSTSKKTHDV